VKRPFERSVAMLVAGLVLGGVLPAPAVHAQTSQPMLPAGPRPNQIVVTGRGSVDAVPDRLTISLVTQAIRPSQQDAQQQRDAAVQRIVRDVGALGVAQQDIVTTTSVHPQRGRPPAGQQPGQAPVAPAVAGYVAIGRIVVSVNSPALATRVVSAATAGGAARLVRVRAGVRDPSQYHTQALRLAVERAQADAMTIASAAGVSTPRLVQMQEIPGPSRPGFGRRGPRPSQGWSGQGIRRPGPGGPHQAAERWRPHRSARRGRRPATIPQTIPVVVMVRAVYTF
jgi:uncharacterized protein